MKNILIIGAGLSGIYLATLLQKQFNVTVLEARDRIGGRILTVDGFDMGPSWVWSHQHNILKLIAENALGIFQQYTKGVALYDTPGGVEHFTPPPSAPSARIKGGVITLVDALAEKLHSGTVRLNAVVTAVEQSGQKLLVKTEEKIFEADIVISTLPPRLAVEKIAYLPPLSPDLLTQLAAIPTWMGYSAK
ncbi:MAG: FAD-dependent oxidoreductase, partial [Thiovulaceae bacterium]|nr:FAD-dependent oxidoreductase [Sulfurimonadaceae bacterium]